MKRVSKISVKEKFKTFSLSFETKEFLDDIDDNVHNTPDSSLETDERRAWLKEDKPALVKVIDRQLRRNFDIPEKNKMVFSLYSPPKEEGGKFIKPSLVIKDQNENILTRIIISTVMEQVELTIGNSEEEKMMMKPWEAYQTPPLFGGVLGYTFHNQKNIVMEARKGFRQVRRSKKVNERYLLVFDYIITKDDLDKLSEGLQNIKTDNIKHNFEETIKNLLA